MIERPAFVYIMANKPRGTIYLGSTIDLVRRAGEHRTGAVPGFTQRYGCKLLVWYEVHDSWESARLRERRMKEWRRAWKVQEIEATNPAWRDLYNDIARP